MDAFMLFLVFLNFIVYSFFCVREFLYYDDMYYEYYNLATMSLCVVAMVHAKSIKVRLAHSFFIFINIALLTPLTVYPFFYDVITLPLVSLALFAAILSSGGIGFFLFFFTYTKPFKFTFQGGYLGISAVMVLFAPLVLIYFFCVYTLQPESFTPLSLDVGYKLMGLSNGICFTAIMHLLFTEWVLESRKYKLCI